MAAVSEIYQYRKVSESLATSGQPKESHIAAAAAEGYTVVINLGLHDDQRYALADERAAVAAVGMKYVHIPVQFGCPTEADLVAFLESMDAHEDERVLVHCAANKRVSAFLGLYLVIRKGNGLDQAFALMRSVWEPDDVWASFIKSMLSKHGTQTNFLDQAESQ